MSLSTYNSHSPCRRCFLNLPQGGVRNSNKVAWYKDWLCLFECIFHSNSKYSNYNFKYIFLSPSLKILTWHQHMHGERSLPWIIKIQPSFRPPNKLLHWRNPTYPKLFPTLDFFFSMKKKKRHNKIVPLEAVILIKLRTFIKKEVRNFRMMVYCVIYIDLYLWILFMIGEPIFLHAHTEISGEKSPYLPTLKFLACYANIRIFLASFTWSDR